MCLDQLPAAEAERMDKAVMSTLKALKPRIGELAKLLTNPPLVSRNTPFPSPHPGSFIDIGSPVYGLTAHVPLRSAGSGLPSPLGVTPSFE